MKQLSIAALVAAAALAGLGATLAPEEPEQKNEQAAAAATAKGGTVRPFLMFEGEAEEAMRFYVSLFDDAKVESLLRYGPGEAGAEGSVHRAIFSIGGREFMCFDSPIEHPFTFTPSISLFVTCDSKEEVDRLFAALSDGGEVLMPLDAYPFSRRFAWVSDRFGVSWQITVPLE